jgi:hypothetical protein
MRFAAGALLGLSLLLSGCGAMRHGPATRVVSSGNSVRNVMTRADEVDRQTIQELQLSDAAGREWTESVVVDSERVSLSQIEDELFQQAAMK